MIVKERRHHLWAWRGLWGHYAAKHSAQRDHMLSLYMQRSWIVLFLFATLLPMYFFATPILELLGQPSDVAAQAGRVGIGLLCTYTFSLWVAVFLMYGYVALGGCPDSWKGFSMEVFAGLWDFSKLSAASGVMICLENWYYRKLLLLRGKLKNAKIAVDTLSVCISINAWEMMIPFAFFAGTGVRVANELGAGNGKGARFATIVSVVTTIIGLFFCILVMVLRDKVALIFTSSSDVLEAVDKLSVLLAATIPLNSVQPILSGVAVGSGRQATVAYINISCYCLIGVPVGIIMGWIFKLGVLGIWGGMIGGTFVQTLILAFITIRWDWEKEALKASTCMEKADVLKEEKIKSDNCDDIILNEL